MDPDFFKANFSAEYSENSVYDERRTILNRLAWLANNDEDHRKMLQKSLREKETQLSEMVGDLDAEKEARNKAEKELAKTKNNLEEALTNHEGNKKKMF